MWSPRQHFDYLLLLIINLLPTAFTRYRILAISTGFFLLFTTSLLNAQVVTVHNPDIQVTITPEKVMAMGETAKNIDRQPVVLDFEGLFNLDDIQQFYNDGTSKDGYSGKPYRVNFREGALVVIDAQHGGSGNFLSDTMPNTVLFFLEGNKISLNFNNGFTDGFSFLYSSLDQGTVSIYDGLDETGNILASKVFQPNLTTNPESEGIIYNKWQLNKVKFNGTAKSVVITGVANRCAFDNLTFGVYKYSGSGISGGGGKDKSGFVSALTTPIDPTEKGKLFLTGASRFGISVGSEKSKSGGSTVDDSKSTYYDLDFLPKAGYFFIDNLVGGIFIDLELYNNKTKSSGYGYKGTTFIIGPFARYYVPVTSQIVPFAEAQVGFGIDNYSSRSSSSSDWYKTKENVFTYRLGAGATYFINNIVGFDMFMGFLHDAYIYKDSDDEDRSSDSKSIYNEFNLQLGIVVVLDLKK